MKIHLKPANPWLNKNFEYDENQTVFIYPYSYFIILIGLKIQRFKRIKKCLHFNYFILYFEALLIIAR